MIYIFVHLVAAIILTLFVILLPLSFLPILGLGIIGKLMNINLLYIAIVIGMNYFIYQIYRKYKTKWNQKIH